MPIFRNPDLFGLSGFVNKKSLPASVPRGGIFSTEMPGYRPSLCATWQTG
jgi:hypothetical protein